MGWLLEKPLFIVAIGLLTSALLGGFWLQTGRKPLVYALALVVSLTCALVLLERAVETDREQIEATLEQISRDVERNDLDAVLRYLDPTATEIRRRAAAEFARFEFQRVSIKQNLEISIQADQQPAAATATFNVVVVLSERSGLHRERSGMREEIRAPQFIMLNLRKEEGTWQVTDFDHQPPQAGFQRGR